MAGFLCLFMALSCAGAPIEAQAQNYGNLTFGPSSGNDADEETAEDEAESEEDGPGLNAYGEVAEEYKEQSTIEMTQQSVGIFQQKARRVFGAAPTFLDQIGDTLEIKFRIKEKFHIRMREHSSSHIPAFCNNPPICSKFSLDRQ